VVDGFDEMTARLVGLDRRGRLEPILAPFDSCPVRVVVRDTAIYTEIGAMLWHPSALHDEAGARARVTELLTAHAANAPAAPSDPVVIEAEIRALLIADVPAFVTDPQRGVLTGLDDVVAGTAIDLPKSALAQWRATDPALDRQIIECAVISAYRDETEQLSVSRRMVPIRGSDEHLDRQRRALAAQIIGTAVDEAICGDDGTVTWIAPSVGLNGPTIQPLGLDTYGGLPGVAMILAAYQHEVAAGRADEVPGAGQLSIEVLHTLHVMEDQAGADRDSDLPARPEPPGGYLGLGSRIWSWLRLSQLGAVTPEQALDRATALAGHIPASVAADDIHDVLTGMAGAVAPLLHLARVGGEQRWRDEAVAIGDRLAEVALLAEGRARWPGQRSPQGLGGFAHGSLGIGWALSRLATDTGEDRFARLAGAAFAFQESLYDPGSGGWRDPRKPDGIAANWCYGCDGLGVVAADLDRLEVLSRAAASAWADGFGSTHTICNGDFGSWEVLDMAIKRGVAPAGVTSDRLAAQVLGSLREYGPRCAMTNTMFRPGLMSGTGGMVYQLLRMHPDSALPTVMLPDPAVGGRG
jgi:lantibiotic modifying enzyme